LFFTVLLLAGVLAACSAGSNSDGNSTQSDASDTEETTGTEETPPLDTENPILVAGIFPISRGDAGWHMDNSVKLAVKELNAAGGILGREIRYVVEDDASKADTGMKAMRLLLDQNPDAIFGSHSSAVVLATLEMVTAAQIPQFSTAAVDTLWLETEHPWLFAVRGGDQVSILALAQWAATQNHKTVGVIHESGAWPSGYAATFQKMYTEKIPDAAFVVEQFTAGDKDFTAQLSNLMNCEALLVSAFPDDTANVAMQLRRMGYEGQVLSTSSIGVSYFSELAGDATDGWVGETNYLAGKMDNPRANAYEEAYEAEFGKPPTEMGAALYDGVYLFAQACETAGSVDSESVRTALFGIKDFQGVQGPLTYFGSGEISNRRIVFRISGVEPEIIENVITDYNPDAN
jgi:branched-chain amino acid transport system substrate-binding protein